MTDEYAVTRLRACDASSLKDIYVAYEQICIKYAYAQLNYPAGDGKRAGRCSTEDANDLYQEALIRLYEMFCDRKAELNCKLSTLLIAIMRNVWHSRLRKRPAPLAETVTEMEEDSNQDLLRQWARERLEQTPEPCRTMLNLRYFSSLSFDDIAMAMNYAGADVVRNLITRCRRTFRERFPLDQEKMSEFNPDENIDELFRLDNITPLGSGE